MTIKTYSDKENVEIAKIEYDENIYLGKPEWINNNKTYIGTVSHIYDNENGAEEQVYVLTNNGKDRNAVTYENSDQERTQIEDVTVMMQGSNTHLNNSKNIHDTYTDWLITDLPTATHRLNPLGATGHALKHLAYRTHRTVTEQYQKDKEKANNFIADSTGNIAGIFNKKAGEAAKAASKQFLENPLFETYHTIKSNVNGMTAAGAATFLSFNPLLAASSGYYVGSKKFPPQQFKDAAAHLKEIIKKYPNAKINLSSHSLGSMDTQYALASLTEEELEHINVVHIYNGPNIYPLLTKEQQAKLDKVKHKIFNYIDHKDLVSLGYPEVGSDQSVGVVHHIASTPQSISDQHMMKGYIYNADGSLQYMPQSARETMRDGVRVSKLPYEKIKQTLSSTGGGLDGHEKIFLDSTQANIIASNLTTVSSNAMEQLQQARDKAVEKAEDLAKQLRTVPWGFSLSPAEMADAYNEGGASRETIVTDITDHFDDRLAKAQAIHDTFTKLEGQIKSGIQQMLDSDQKLAGEFSQWESMM